MAYVHFFPSFQKLLQIFFLKGREGIWLGTAHGYTRAISVLGTRCLSYNCLKLLLELA